MHPDLFSIGPLHIRTYGAFMALGFLVAWKVIDILCHRAGRNSEGISNLLLAMMVSGIVGARAAYVIEHWRAEFANNLVSIIRVDQGGLMFYGGLILAMAVFFGWCLVKREKVLQLSDMLSVVVPLAHAFGRVGCFFYGCCYGRRCDGAAGVVFPRGSPAWYEQVNRGMLSHDAAAALPVLPTQLYEAAAVFCLFLAMYFLHKRFHATRAGLVTGAYLAGYACLRFGLEVLRGDPRAAVGPFSISQTISLVMLFSGFAFISVAFFRKIR